MEPANLLFPLNKVSANDMIVRCLFVVCLFVYLFSLPTSEVVGYVRVVLYGLLQNSQFRVVVGCVEYSLAKETVCGRTLSSNWKEIFVRVV